MINKYKNKCKVTVFNSNTDKDLKALFKRINEILKDKDIDCKDILVISVSIYELRLYYNSDNYDNEIVNIFNDLTTIKYEKSDFIEPNFDIITKKFEFILEFDNGDTYHISEEIK